MNWKDFFIWCHQNNYWEKKYLINKCINEWINELNVEIDRLYLSQIMHRQTGMFNAGTTGVHKHTHTHTQIKTLLKTTYTLSLEDQLDKSYETAETQQSECP